MVSTEDRQWFQQLLRGRLSDEFKSSPDDILGEGILLYGDFMAPNADVKVYDEITDYEKVCVCVCVHHNNSTASILPRLRSPKFHATQQLIGRMGLYLSQIYAHPDDCLEIISTS